MENSDVQRVVIHRNHIHDHDGNRVAYRTAEDQQFSRRKCQLAALQGHECDAGESNQRTQHIHAFRQPAIYDGRQQRHDNHRRIFYKSSCGGRRRPKSQEFKRHAAEIEETHNCAVQYFLFGNTANLLVKNQCHHRK